MKKLVALLIAAVMLFSCTAALAEGWEIVVVPKDASNPWFVRMTIRKTPSIRRAPRKSTPPSSISW